MEETNETYSPDLLQTHSHKDFTILMSVFGMLSLFSVLGSIGNALVLYVYSRKRNTLASTIFIITLACTDLLTCAVIIPVTVIYEQMNHYVKFDFICKCYMCVITSTVPFSAFIMVAIAVDRYLCICHPYMKKMSIKQAKRVVFYLGMTVLVLGIITSLNFGVSYPEMQTVVSNFTLNDTTATYISETSLEIGGVCTSSEQIFSKSFFMMYQNIYSGFFVVGLGTIISLYCMIYRFAKLQLAQRTGMRRRKQEMTTISKKAFSANMRRALTLFVVTAVFILVFLPAWLMAQQIIPYNILVFYMHFFCNVANPIVYSFINKSFILDLRYVFRKVAERV